jgi:hypothetical protein
VTGSGDTRALAIQTGGFVPNGATVSWTRPASGGYDDTAGNPLDSFGSLTTQGLIAKIVDLTPEQGAPGVGTTYVLTARVTDEFSTNISGQVVGLRAVTGPSSSRDFDGTGPNPPGVIGSCFTQSEGTCNFSYTSNVADLDELQAWIDSDGNPATIDTPAPEPRDESGGDQPNQDVVDVGWSSASSLLRLNANPENATVPVGQPHVVTMTVLQKEDTLPGNSTPRAAYEGVTVALRSLSGPNQGFIGDCDTGADGICKVAYVSDAKGSDKLQAWIDTDDDHTTAGDGLFQAGDERADADGLPAVDDAVQDVMNVTWAGVAILHLDLEPEQSSHNAREFNTFSFKVLDQGDAPVEGVTVAARVVSGPNAGMHIDCRTKTDGTCATGYDSTKVGTDIVQGWIDINNNGIADEPTSNEARAESPGADDPVQDVVTVDWIVEGLRVEANPETSTAPVGSKTTLAVRTVDADGNGIEAVPVAARSLAGSLLGSCQSTSDGSCNLEITSRRIGTEQVQTWIDLNRNGSPDEASTAENADDTLATQDNQDVVQVTWTLEGADLLADASPESATAKRGSQQPISLTATDTSGAKIVGVPLAAKVMAGPSADRDLDSDPTTPNGTIGTCTTKDDGTCSLSFTSQTDGVDLVLTWIDANGDRTSNEVPQSEPRTPGAGADVHNQDVTEVTWGSRAGRSISIAKPPTKSVKYRSPVTLHGDLSGDPSCTGGVTIELQRRATGENAFSKITTFKSQADGAWSISFNPETTAVYRAVAREDDQCLLAQSDSVPVAVKAKVQASVAKTRLHPGQCTRIRTTVLPAKAGRAVRLQIKAGFGWKNVKQRALSPTSTAKFKLCSPSSGRYRILWPGDAVNDRASSRTFRIRVI